MIKLLILLVLSFGTTGLAAETASIDQTKSKIKTIDSKINNLKHNLSSEANKRATISQDLASTEKKISASIASLQVVQRDLQGKKQKIAALQTQKTHLQQQLQQQQQALASHLRARYYMGKDQALKWLIKQNDPHHFNRILTYYHYIVHSRQQLIDKINRTEVQLQQNQSQINKELAENQNLQRRIEQQQQELLATKNHQDGLIATINNDIQDQQRQLKEYQKNKNALTNLLQNLAQNSVVQASKSLLHLRKKLPLPVQTANRSFKKMNQGVTFFAEEGSHVTAIYPGKVVFSDWLKGYGLLLIIDHGQGFMSLYAHNQALFKHKGDMVKQHDLIASVGHSGGIKENGLYFEIRERGKAVSPLGWLT